MNKKYKIAISLSILSVLTYIILFTSLYTIDSKYKNIYNKNYNKLDKINKEISFKNITKENMKYVIENNKNNIEKLNEDKKEVQDEFLNYLSNKGLNHNGIGRTIYLTFDDGPSNYTDDILNILDKHKIKATFFLTCNDRTKEFTRKIYDKGHTVALHTCTHKYSYIYESKENYFEDLNNINNIVKDEINVDTKIIRFPGGSSNTVSRFTPNIMSELSDEVKEKGYKYFDWNVDSMDASGYDSKEEFNHMISVLDYTYYKENIVLMHDTKLSTHDSLDDIIIEAKKRGYNFNKITEDTEEVHHLINN